MPNFINVKTLPSFHSFRFSETLRNSKLRFLRIMIVNLEQFFFAFCLFESTFNGLFLYGGNAIGFQQTLELKLLPYFL